MNTIFRLPCMLWMLCVAWAIAADVRAEAPKGNFEAHDLSLWILDPNATLANAARTFRRRSRQP